MNVLKGNAGEGGGGGTTNLAFQGGSVETAPAVYIVYWGSWWNGTSTTGTDGGYEYGPLTAKANIEGFFGNVGESTWDGVNSQYCQNVAVGRVTCGASGTRIQNLKSQMDGSYVDASTSVPRKPTQSQIAADAVRVAQHFGFSPTIQRIATVFVLTPSGSSISGFGTSWCAWLSSTNDGGVHLPYAYLPYQPDAGRNCGENFVNSTSSQISQFGNGYFDGFSVVGGHEYAEA